MDRLSEAYSKLRLQCANLVSSLDDWYYKMQEERDNTKADENCSNFVDFDKLKESQFVKKSVIGFYHIADILKNFWNLVTLHLKKPSFGICNWKISPRARTLAIGWINFLVCFIPFVAVICYSITGAVDLDVFLYNTPGQNPTQVKYLKSISPFAREERVLTLLKRQELKYELTEIHAKYPRIEGGRPSIEEWKNYELSPSEMYNQDANYYWTSRAIVKLSDFITDEDLLKFVHTILFAAGGDSIFFLIIVGTIFGIGVVFNGLLLVGAHTNNVTSMSVWIPYQRLIFVFDLYCLLVITVASSIPAIAVFQTARIFIRWWCIRTVNRHLKSFGSPESHKPEFYKTQFDKTQFYKTQFDKTQFDKTQFNLLPNNNTESKPIDVSVLAKVIEAC